MQVLMVLLILAKARKFNIINK